MNFDWNQLAFASKKSVRDLNATFIAAPRELSTARFTQLIKTYLPKRNILLGIAKEAYVEGLENQPQFKMLRGAPVQPIINKVNGSASRNKIYTLAYLQRELPFVIEKLRFAHAVFVNGSWYRSFHLRPEYYQLMNQGTAYELVSPFANEAEAMESAKRLVALISSQPIIDASSPHNEAAMLALAKRRATWSFDHTYQTGAILGKKQGSAYRIIATGSNDVVPYQTFAMHHGSLREQHFSPANDLNYYDTIHAEVALLLDALNHSASLKGTTLFINLLPCPTCARMIAATEISEIVYELDHSDGYAYQLLVQTGKIVRRINTA